MPILAAVGQRKSCRIGKAIGRTVNDLGNHRKRAYGTCPDAGCQQQIGEVNRSPLGRSGKRAMQPSREDIPRSHVVMRRHDEGAAAEKPAPAFHP